MKIGDARIRRSVISKKGRKRDNRQPTGGIETMGSAMKKTTRAGGVPSRRQLG